MKGKITLLTTSILLGCLSASAQYTYTNSHTAEELLAELAGDGLTILNPVLTCRDSFNAIYSGTGGLDFDNGIALSTGKLHKVFAENGDYAALDSEGDMFVPVTSNDREMNDMIDRYGYAYGEAYSTCAIDMDIVPQAKTLEMDFIFSATPNGGLFDCEPATDYIAVLISGGTGFTDTANLITYPDTDVPVSAWTMAADSAMVAAAKSYPFFCDYVVGEEVIPLDDYTINNTLGIYDPNICHKTLTTAIPITAVVTACDTYHIKIAISQGRNIGDESSIGTELRNPYASTFFLKSGSLRTTGQPEDCPTTEPPSSLSEYLKQQKEIKVSPNPFNNSLAIAIENDSGKELYEIGLYDIGGRLLNQSKGNLNEVNASLAAIGNDLATGMYLLKIKSASGKYNHTVKVVKE